jgi:hypothetical protein
VAALFCEMARLPVYFDIRNRERANRVSLTIARSRVQYGFVYRRNFRYAKIAQQQAEGSV